MKRLARALMGLFLCLPPTLSLAQRAQFQGVYNPSQQYQVNDHVSFKGVTYESLTINNSGHEPDLSPQYWGILGASTGAVLQDTVNGHTYVMTMVNGVPTYTQIN